MARISYYQSINCIRVRAIYLWLKNLDSTITWGHDYGNLGVGNRKIIWVAILRYIV